VFFVYACSPVRYVPDGEYLLNRVAIQIEGKAANRAELKKNIRQKPNTRILGVARFHLGLYNLSGKNEERRLNRWLRSIGEAPVIYNHFMTDRSVIQLTSYLNNKGYYQSQVTDTVYYRKKRAFVEYRIRPGEQTRIGEFGYAERYSYIENTLKDTARVMKEIVQDSANTLIRPGSSLDTDLMEQERERITRMLREKGYFNFSKNLIQYYADTAYRSDGLQARLLLSVTDNPPDTAAYSRYTIGKIRIRFDHEPSPSLPDGTGVRLDSNYREYDISFRDGLKIKPKLIAETLQFQEGELYNVKKVVDTYSRLQSLNLFKFINLAFRETGDRELECEVQLTAIKRQSYNLFIETTHNSGNIGLGGNLTYNHRNLFRSGENLTLSVWGALRKEQVSKEEAFFNTTEMGAELKLTTPEFWLPLFRMENFRRNFNPRTAVSLSYTYENTPYYNRQIANARFGYLWRRYDKKWLYNFDLIDLNYVQMKDVDDGFIEGLQNEYVKSAYKSHLIFSANFSGTFTDRLQEGAGSYHYFRWNLESSGNVLQAATTLLDIPYTTDESTSSTYRQVLGVRFAQFAKADGEYRYNHYINRANTLVGRFFAGCAYPYGNWKTLPFEEAYYGGGANGIRAWQSRTLGPGSYIPEETYPNSVGDFKLEANLEYRFKLFWILEGALFLDGGNVWNITPFENRRGAKLGSDFYRQIALGTGAGLRLDANFFLLRFDWGVKMRDPAQEKGERFVLIENGKWLRKTVFNIAIGYPF
jgi:outer membrane protein assembly factor BamA